MSESGEVLMAVQAEPPAGFVFLGSAWSDVADYLLQSLRGTEHAQPLLSRDRGQRLAARDGGALAELRRQLAPVAAASSEDAALKTLLRILGASEGAGAEYPRRRQARPSRPRPPP